MYYGSVSMSVKRISSVITAVIASGCMLFAVVPSAQAADAASNAVVTSSRSFPKVQTVKRDLLAESTSTSVAKGDDWGDIGNLDVPKTKSQAEKDAEAQAKAEAEAQAKAEKEAAAAAQAQAEAAAASRSQARESIDSTSSSSSDASSSTADSSSSSSSAASAAASALAAYASQFVGYPYAAGGNTPSGWDCSGFVQYVFAHFGISLPRTSGAQATVGTAVASLADAKPGDILANGSHAAIYLGGGLIINALNPADGTQITTVNVTTFASGYSIRRVL
ncbi:peptidase P60 [Bifidobacterium ramosum]|uniref:Peptidase P60 n=2 Tax=Bifidobacterium ramosum TaxID=1798158 RepID=A0A6L4X0L1_9BIFI|nr:peptidase P60 [Bifidobacterium ramosum]